MKSTYLGIDLGTSAMKFVLIDEDKNVLKQITEKYHVTQDANGWSEINPEIWFSCLNKGVKKIFEKCDGRLLKRIGITGQMHTLIVLDEDGNVIRPALMWNDLRTKEKIPEIRKVIENFSEGEYLSKIISTGSPAANLLWLKQNEPDNFKKIHKFLIGPDYLVYKLTGNYTTDFCEASTSCLYEIRAHKWSKEMQELLGLKNIAYPQVKGSAEVAGILKEEVAYSFGVNSNVEVLVGTGDNPATAISTGCLVKGYPVISLGTSGVLMMPVKDPQSYAKGKVILFSFEGINYSYLVQGVVQSNGSTFDWCAKKIMGFKDFKNIDDKININDVIDSEVLFYPHLNGDKTIYSDPNLRGAFIGLGINTDKYTLLYAVIEGLCFGLKQLVEEMHLPIKEFDAIKVVGGGANSKIWMQTLANVLNKKVEKMDGMIGPAFGVAFLAAYSDKNDSYMNKITESTLKIECCYYPNLKATEICNKKYKKYLRMQKGIQYISEE